MKTTFTLAAIGLCLGTTTLAHAADQQFHPLEQYCVWYEHTGTMMTGESQMCMRKHGQESFTISQTGISMMGITQNQNTHTITIGDKIYNINLDTMTGTETTNPMYEGLSNADPEDLTAKIMAGLGLTDTGQDKDIAGVTCNILSSAQMGSACFTDDMIMLEQDIMGNTQTATQVDLDSGGDDANYNLHNSSDVTMSEGPDINQILQGLGVQ